MKKIFTALLMCTVLACTILALASCSSDQAAVQEDYIGKWEAITDGYGNYYMDFNADGTATVDFIGIKSSGTWEIDDEGEFIVTTDKIDDFEVDSKDDQLSIEFGGKDIVFDKTE